MVSLGKQFFFLKNCPQERKGNHGWIEYAIILLQRRVKVFLLNLDPKGVSRWDYGRRWKNMGGGGVNNLLKNKGTIDQCRIQGSPCSVYMYMYSSLLKPFLPYSWTNPQYIKRFQVLHKNIQNSFLDNVSFKNYMNTFEIESISKYSNLR